MLNRGLFSLFFYWMAEEALRAGHNRKELANLKIKIGKAWDHVGDCAKCQGALVFILKREGADHSFPADFLEIARAFRLLNHYPACIKESLLDHLLDCLACQTKSLDLYKRGNYSDALD